MSKLFKHLKKSKNLKIRDYDNFFVSIDKPKGITSFDVIRRIRFEIPFKLGHCGTLDPLATGLLILASNNATKQISLLQDADKSYTFTMKLGESTLSYDSESEVTNTSDAWKSVTKEDILSIISTMKGEIDQEAPAYSALKIKGKRLYEMARNNEIIEKLPVRKIFIHQIELLELENQFAKFFVKCGKGTYIRSICNDIGNQLKCFGHVTELRRESIGEYHVNDAFKMDEFLSICQQSKKEQKS
jgi:tRNA pseudouridine55 synthase